MNCKQSTKPMLAMLSLFSITSPAWADDEGLDAVTEFDIPAQPLEAALIRFSEQADLQLVMASATVDGKEVEGVSGEYVNRDVLDNLLAGTGLAYQSIDDRTVAVSEQEASVPSGKSQPASSPMLMAQAQTSAQQDISTQKDSTTTNNDNDDRPSLQFDEIVVTGTSIRGVYPESSPLSVYDATDISNSGVSTLEQFIEKLPQNLNTLSGRGGRAIGGQTNIANVNGIDLRGLGTGTTLVLLNGRRLALSSSGRTPDISLLPLAVVDRVEVLTDGASAIYGSDAVGGVVNFVLKDRLDGAETSLSYGSVTDGDHDELRVEQNLGTSWGTGHVLGALSFMDRSSLEATDRDYATDATPYTLIPEDERYSALLTFEQQFAGSGSVFADLLYSKRDSLTDRLTTNTNIRFAADAEQEQYFVNLGARKAITDRLSAELIGSYSAVESITDIGRTDLATSEVTAFPVESESSTLELTAKVDGDLFTIRGNDVKFSVGAGYAEDEHEPDMRAKLKRDTVYVFGELLAPLIRSEHDVPGVDRLELSLAARYTDYSEFGSDTSPKIGLLWSPAPSLNLRSTFAESFRAPFLSQLDPTTGFYTLFPLAPFGLPDFWSDDNSTRLMLAQGPGNPDLAPESAESFTVGFDYEPNSLPGLSIHATYFNIDYEDRIATGDPSGGFAAFAAPEEFSDLFVVGPSLEQITSVITTGTNGFNFFGVDVTDPVAVRDVVDVLFDNRVRNLSISELDGVDFGIGYDWQTKTGNFSVGSELTYVFDYEQQITSNSPIVDNVGVVFSPADLKLRAHIGLVRSFFNAQVSVNHIDGYENPFAVVDNDVSSWTTVDLNLSYEFTREAERFLDGMRVSLSFQNLFDKDPPFVEEGTLTNQGLVESIGYDPTNANPLGRFVRLQITKTW